MADVLVIAGTTADGTVESIAAALRQRGIDAGAVGLDRPDDPPAFDERLVYAPIVAEPVSQILAREIEHAPLKPRYCLLFVSATALHVPAFVWLLNNLTCVSAEDGRQIIIVAETPDLMRRLKHERWKEHRIFLLSDRTVDEIVSHVESLRSFPLVVNWSDGAPMFSMGRGANRDL